MTLRENLAYCKYFGIKISFWKTINSIAVKINLPLKKYIRKKNESIIEEYIQEVCPITFSKMKVSLDIPQIVKNNILKQPIIKNNVIWTMWWQGENNAPDIVKFCINSMKKNSNGHPVIVLDKNNYKDYVILPKHIEERYLEGVNDESPLKKCVVDQTRLSDIIRCYLLFYYGGLWCDATIFFSKAVPESYFKDNWTTLGQDNLEYVGQGKWSSFFWGCQNNNKLMGYAYQMHVEYFKNKKYWINYLLIDYMIDIAYKNDEDIRHMIDTVKSGNKKCQTINRNYNKEIDIDEFNKLMEIQAFHKLS